VQGEHGSTNFPIIVSLEYTVTSGLRKEQQNTAGILYGPKFFYIIYKLIFYGLISKLYYPMNRT
jgi:hypothetical protein